MLPVLVEIAGNPSIITDRDALITSIDSSVSQSPRSYAQPAAVIQFIENAAQQGMSVLGGQSSSDADIGYGFLAEIWSNPAQREAWRFTIQSPGFWNMPRSMQDAMLRQFPEGELTRC
jgi:hypothetical protein